MTGVALLLTSFCTLLPHPDKLKTGGEDACFVSNANAALGVADGVGGWADVPGANASKFSRDLMAFANESSTLLSALDILQEAYNRIDKSIKGSTTATVAKLVGNTLDIANVGDSGCSLWRDLEEVYHTKPTLHGFNFPYQLGPEGQDTPSDGTQDSVEVQDGDILVCASDGLWDNVYEDDIRRILKVHRNQNPTKYCRNVSDHLARTARKRGLDQTFDSPFAKEARKFGYRYMGGKLDDVTVVVGYFSGTKRYDL